MELFYIKYTPLEVKKDITDIIERVGNVYKYHTGEVISEVITYRNIDINDQTYICLDNKSKASIYYLEGKGPLIFSIHDINTPDNHEEGSGFINEGEQVDIKTGFACLVTISVNSLINKFVVVKE
ncbi:SWPV2-ORF297 [Shearwaterpox virus]|uniref:SWPV2-ORF297 n=1 Tax=Shearwaterpox virus TaxID=1974596 RepID=A0A1V0QGS3_CNPV|nr:SWPV2-ORF297 [Shearwaterpox virus]QRI43028.1 EFc-like protein [Cheloniid poxvirus 1]QRM15590.1 EFc-like protein [Mudlarkpox virus]QRM15943.1 efc-like protein [Penguinpox virus 2]QRM16280.1 efc-like protein [Albatrosspox virus]